MAPFWLRNDGATLTLSELAIASENGKLECLGMEKSKKKLKS